MTSDLQLITPLYAAILALIYAALSIRTLRLRRRFRVAVGAGDSPVLLRAIRVHGNFAEYVPISLMLLLFLELSVDNDLLVHGLGLTLLIGRSLHAYGVSQVAETFFFRVAGMAMTFTVIFSASLRILAAQAAPFFTN